jgi:hypothetical protein
MCSSIAAIVIFLAVPATAQQVLLDWGPNCFGWETDYADHISGAGSELTILGRIDAFYAPLDFLDPDVMEYTFVFDGLISQGTEVIGGIIFETDYEGGTFRIYEDATPDFEFGTNPPNDTAPSTFTDGVLILEGPLSNFHVFLIDDGTPPGASGTLTANWSVSGGSLFDLMGCCYGPILAAWTDDPDVAPIPEGYTCHADGKFDLEDCPGGSDAQPNTWGWIKGLFH